jgi:oligopeptidase B
MIGSSAMFDRTPKPPVAARRPVTATHHGITISDDYAWLRADNWQDVMRQPDVLDPEIRAFLEAENAHTEQSMAPTVGLQKTLYEEMKARIKEDDSAVPSPDGAWSYYSRHVTGGEYPLICRRPTHPGADGGEGAEQVLLDGDLMGKGLPFFQLAAAEHSPDHQLLAYAVDDKGSEYYTIKVRDLNTGADRADAVPDSGGNVVWHPDCQSFFYNQIDDNHRSLKILQHRLGEPASADRLIYEEHDQGFFARVGATQSRRFILISAGDHQTSEVRLLDTDNPDAGLVLIEPRVPEIEYSVEHVSDQLIILTNADDAEDFKIVTAPITSPGRKSWTDIEPHRAGRLILSHSLFRNHLVRLEREDGLPRIVIRRLSDGQEHAIEFAEAAYALGHSDGYEFDTTRLRFSYSSLASPSATYDYDMETRERTVRKVQEVPSGHNPANYVTRRLMAPAPDGQLVPVSMIYAKGTPIDGTAPLLLYGYGAYGIAMPAGFSTGRLSLVDRGFIYAIAHIRGGKDKGYGWYKDGRLTHKKNTFTDFIAAGEFLVRENFTSSGRIVAHGGSAGGLLMGAVANMAPELFLGIIAEVPFVDVLNTILDASLPLTPPEWNEWGNPIKDPAAFEMIRSYSPYDQVRSQDYPAILALGGLTDPRVTYWEPAKWVARLRALKTNDNPLLMKINMGAGHGGASGRFERLHEVALTYAFALTLAGR